MFIGLIREGKEPGDTRVALTPAQCTRLLEQHPLLQLRIAPYEKRCYKDVEYRGLDLSDNIRECDVLIGIKEVPVNQLISNKTYLFFSHTLKKQPHNRDLLLAVLDKQIRLIDYETLTNDKGFRILGFGRFAGIVGAHNGLLTWGKRSGEYDLKPAYEVHDYEQLKKGYDDIAWPVIKIVICGSGRVAQGAVELLNNAGIASVKSEELLSKTYSEAVFCQLELEEFYEHKSGKPLVESDFFDNPQDYQSSFEPYTKACDLMINAIFWDPAAPVFFSREQMQANDFRIKVIADITCDIEGSVPATIRASEISKPVYGYDPKTGKEVAPYQSGFTDVMAVDNLPNELPRDASAMFGQTLSEQVIPELLAPESEMIQRATIAEDGRLTENFAYLQDYVDG